MSSKADTSNGVSVTMVSDLVMPSGKTWREENLELAHKIPIGTLVEVKYDKWHGDGACEKVHARLYVSKHTRDCDGEPLYILSPRTSRLGCSKCHSRMIESSVNDDRGPFSESHLKTIVVDGEILRGEKSEDFFWSEEERLEFSNK